LPAIQTGSFPAIQRGSRHFDTVCQSKLVELLSRTIKDGQVISLINKYQKAGVIAKGVFARTDTGLAQGGPLSPLLSNIMHNELDWELSRRGHRIVRYADDLMVFCKSRRSAERTLANITPYIEGKIFLKVNREKNDSGAYQQGEVSRLWILPL
jgi:retron-type reverse transcriptase